MCAMLNAPVGGHVEVVTGDAALHLRHARFDFVTLACVQRAHRADKLAVARGAGRLSRPPTSPNVSVSPTREPCFNRQHVVNHVAVAHRTCAAAVIGRHATERGLRRSRDVDGIPQHHDSSAARSSHRARCRALPRRCPPPRRAREGGSRTCCCRRPVRRPRFGRTARCLRHEGAPARRPRPPESSAVTASFAVRGTTTPIGSIW